MSGALIGFTIAIGAYLLFTWYLQTRTSLTNRVRVYLGDSSKPQPGPITVFAQTLTTALVRSVATLGSTNRSVIKRQLQLLQPADLVAFRLRQLSATTLGLLLGCSVSIVIFRQGLWVSITCAVLTALFAAIAVDWLLTRKVRKFHTQITAQLPDAVELLALTVSAGESVGQAIYRVETNLAQPLRAIFTQIRVEQEQGMPLADALRSVAKRLDCQSLERVFTTLATALDRGSPLAEVLHAIATDAREQRRRELMELAGKKEIAMLIPVVFLILPLTVLFALYPGMLYLKTL